VPVLIFMLSRASGRGCIMPPEEATFLVPSGELSVWGSHPWCDGQKFSPLFCLVGIQSHIFHL